jgi:type VI secretion system protein ImpE
MSTPQELLRAGQLGDALQELQQQVRKNPADAKARVFLFQLLAVLGQWERALTQLNVSGELDPGALAMVQTYREALRCEALREQVFAGKRSPMIFGDPEPWIALMLQALQLDGEGRSAEAQKVRAQAFEQAPATAGSIDGQAFEWIADADQRLGPILEVIVNGNYYWVPMHRIRRVRMEAPEDLRDAVWMPAYLTWSNAGESVGLIPTRYPGTQACEDDQLRLARKTEWTAVGEDAYTGLGQRLLATDSAEYALMDIRQIEFATDASVVDAAAGERGG